MLTFRASDHRYFWNGKPVVNVTRALSLITNYDRIPAGILKHAQDEGIAIHRTVELYCKGDLDEDSLPEWLVPRLAAFKKFLAETGFAIEASEQRVYHERYGYAGQLDFVGTMQMPQGRKVRTMPAIVDVKRSFFAGRAIGLQVAAYDAALPSERPRLRYALQLRADATYRFEPFNDPSDFPNFIACLSVWRLKEQMQFTKEVAHA